MGFSYPSRGTALRLMGVTTNVDFSHISCELSFIYFDFLTYVKQATEIEICHETEVNASNLLRKRCLDSLNGLQRCF